jgi:hypothetical protein
MLALGAVGRAGTNQKCAQLGEVNNVRVVMLDAIRGTIEGGKATHSVRMWLMENSGPQTVMA